MHRFGVVRRLAALSEALRTQVAANSDPYRLWQHVLYASSGAPRTGRRRRDARSAAPAAFDSFPRWMRSGNWRGAIRAHDETRSMRDVKSNISAMMRVQHAVVWERLSEVHTFGVKLRQATQRAQQLFDLIGYDPGTSSLFTWDATPPAAEVAEGAQLAWRTIVRKDAYDAPVRDKAYDWRREHWSDVTLGRVISSELMFLDCRAGPAWEAVFDKGEALTATKLLEAESERVFVDCVVVARLEYRGKSVECFKESDSDLALEPGETAEVLVHDLMTLQNTFHLQKGFGNNWAVVDFERKVLDESCSTVSWQSTGHRTEALGAPEVQPPKVPASIDEPKTLGSS